MSPKIQNHLFFHLFSSLSISISSFSLDLLIFSFIFSFSFSLLFHLLSSLFHLLSFLFRLLFHFFGGTRVAMVMHVVRMIDSREWDETHTTVELEKGAPRVALVVGSAQSELAASGRPSTKKANGRLHLRLCDPSVSCNGTALNVLTR